MDSNEYKLFLVWEGYPFLCQYTHTPAAEVIISLMPIELLVWRVNKDNLKVQSNSVCDFYIQDAHFYYMLHLILLQSCSTIGRSYAL